MPPPKIRQFDAAPTWNVFCSTHLPFDIPTGGWRDGTGNGEGASGRQRRAQPPHAAGSKQERRTARPREPSPRRSARAHRGPRRDAVAPRRPSTPPSSPCIRRRTASSTTPGATSRSSTTAAARASRWISSASAAWSTSRCRRAVLARIPVRVPFAQAEVGIVIYACCGRWVTGSSRSAPRCPACGRRCVTWPATEPRGAPRHRERARRARRLDTPSGRRSSPAPERPRSAPPGTGRGRARR